MANSCNYPPSANGGRYCRDWAIDHRHSDGKSYCAYHLGVVRENGSPWPVKIRSEQNQ